MDQEKNSGQQNFVLTFLLKIRNKNMGFQSIRNAIKTRLETISSIQEVADYPNEQFGGFPAAMIASTRNEGEFEMTKENKRTYVFTIYLLQDEKSQGARQARRIIEGVVDDVIQSFDEDQLLDGVSLSSSETMIICFPALSDIYETPDGKYIVGEMELRVVVSVSII